MPFRLSKLKSKAHKEFTDFKLEAQPEGNTIFLHLAYK